MQNINNDTEIWKDIVGWEGYYQASNLGRIKSLSNKKLKLNNIDKILVQLKHQKYPCVSFSRKNFNKTFRIDYLIATTFLGKPIDKPVLKHIDNDYQNNKISNLKWEELIQSTPEQLNTEEEVWKPIPNFPDYLISSKGRIKSLLRERRPNVYFPEKFLTPDINNNGYYRITLTKGDGTQKQLSIHRLLALLFIPNPNNYPQVNHKNDIKTDNRLTNLYWGDQKQNKRDAMRNGHFTLPNGEKNPQAKLKEEDIKRIRMLYESGMFTHEKIAESFNVKRRQIGRIINKQRWAHVE